LIATDIHFALRIILQLIDKVSKLEGLKQDEVAFKQQCHEELEELQNKIRFEN
jgi:hypothetical protein